MQPENGVFFFSEPEKQLFCRERGGQYGKLTPEDIRREMAFSKSARELHIHRLTQEGLEFFVEEYGRTYETLYLDGCTGLTDLSPLAGLENLAALCIEDCRGVEGLWDMAGNRALRMLSIRGAKKITLEPAGLDRAPNLEELRFWGSKYHMRSLDWLRGMRALRRLDLNDIVLDGHDMAALAELPALEEFHFDEGMLATGEIAAICAKYPELYGQSLGAYTVTGANEVRICGARKPTLQLPKDQARLEKYIAQFEELKQDIIRRDGT